MNKLTKLILTAGLLALAACSGKGTGTSFDDSELMPSNNKNNNTNNGGQQQSGSTSYCDYYESDNGQTIHVFCADLESSICTKAGGKVVSSCPTSHIDVCPVDNYTVFTYETYIKCSDIEQGYRQYVSQYGGSTNQNSGSNQSSSQSSSNNISSLCSAGMYENISCSGSSTWYVCGTDGKYYSCSSDGSNCMAYDMTTYMSTCMSGSFDDYGYDDYYNEVAPVSDDYYTYY